ncbi:hypothetical protein [Piscinibacter sakaiensis]|uniref:hypothetical protein n=1 Tax=Piscinibacter sakaiensis TaxID=1547922 RepID=UPI003AAEA557
MNATALFLAVVFGSLGFAYLYYARQQRASVPAICGVLLLVVPYFLLARPMILLVIGSALALLPFFYRR